jgi:hypothetical protein
MVRIKSNTRCSLAFRHAENCERHQRDLLLVPEAGCSHIHVGQLMKTIPIEHSKFETLRAKTEKQLVQLVNNGLDLGIRNARQALRSADTWAVAEECNRCAESSYAEVSVLIPLIAEIPQDEWGGVESRSEQLQGMLEALSAIGSTLPPTHRDIGNLAHALWEERGCQEGLPDEDWFLAERALKTQW